MAMEGKEFDVTIQKKLSCAIQEHKVIVIDNNLSEHQLEIIINIAQNIAKPLFVYNVSDSKINRLINLMPDNKDKLFEVISFKKGQFSKFIAVQCPRKSGHLKN